MWGDNKRVIDLSSPPSPRQTRWNPLEPVVTRSNPLCCNPLGPVVTRLEFWSCVLTTFLWGRLHNREKKDWEREKSFLYVLHHLRPYNTERERERSFVWERKILKFLLCHNEWMRGQHKFLCSFWSCGLRETSMMVDYTQILKKKDWEKKGKMYVFTITSPAALQHREKKFCMRKKNF